MTEIKLTLEDPAEFARWAHAHAGQMPPTWSARAGQLDAIAHQIEEQVKPVPPEPELSFSVINARPSYSDTVTTLTKLGDHWVNLDADAVGAYETLSEVEVLRIGVGEEKAEPLAEWESDLLNLQYRRETAVAVLEAMDVDQYLIDAVANASATPGEPDNASFTEGFDAACNEILKALRKLRADAIAGEHQDAYDESIAAVERELAWS